MLIKEEHTKNMFVRQCNSLARHSFLPQLVSTSELLKWHVRFHSEETPLQNDISGKKIDARVPPFMVY